MHGPTVGGSINYLANIRVKQNLETDKYTNLPFLNMYVYVLLSNITFIPQTTVS